MGTKATTVRAVLSECKELLDNQQEEAAHWWQQPVPSAPASLHAHHLTWKEQEGV